GSPTGTAEARMGSCRPRPRSSSGSSRRQSARRRPGIGSAKLPRSAGPVKGGALPILGNLVNKPVQQFKCRVVLVGRSEVTFVSDNLHSARAVKHGAPSPVITPVLIMDGVYKADIFD